MLLLSSIGWNFWVGMRIGSNLQIGRDAEKRREEKRREEKRTIARRWFIAGITVNLMLLAYFKYANFFVDNLSLLIGHRWDVGQVK